MSFILIILVHVGPLGDGNSNSITSVPGFKSQAECESAGRKAQNLTNGSTKKIEFVCVQQGA